MIRISFFCLCAVLNIIWCFLLFPVASLQLFANVGSCTDVKSHYQTAKNGVYSFGGMTVYCNDMDLSPKEYIDLPNSDKRMTDKLFSNDVSTCHYIAHYNKMRVRKMANLEIDLSDMTFANIVSSPYNSDGCVEPSELAGARYSLLDAYCVHTTIDLTNTPFLVSAVHDFDGTHQEYSNDGVRVIMKSCQMLSEPFSFRSFGLVPSFPATHSENAISFPDPHRRHLAGTSCKNTMTLCLLYDDNIFIY
jgi:hypothetical protein